MSRLVFTDKGHRYSLDGVYVPSVTTATGVLDKPALPKWAARETALWCANNADMLQRLGYNEWVDSAKKSPWAQRDRKAEFGTEVHAAAERLLETGEADVAEDIEDHVKQCAAFLDAWNVEAVHTERPVYNDALRYAGRVDLIADLRDGNRWLLDFKTGSGIYKEHVLQQAGYRFASHLVDDNLEDIPMPEVDKVGIVHIQADHWNLVPVVADTVAFQAFGNALRLVAWQRLDDDAVIGAPLPIPSGVNR